MARSQRQRQVTGAQAASPHRTAADQMREYKEQSRSDAAKACFSQAAMCHDTAARLTDRIERLKKAATEYRSAALFWGAKRRADMAAMFTRQAVAAETALQTIPASISQWISRAMEHTARGHEMNAAHVEPDRSEAEAAWQAHHYPEAASAEKTERVVGEGPLLEESRMKRAARPSAQE